MFMAFNAIVCNESVHRLLIMCHLLRSISLGFLSSLVSPSVIVASKPSPELPSYVHATVPVHWLDRLSVSGFSANTG